MSNANTVQKVLEAGVVTVLKALTMDRDDGTEAIGQNVFAQQVPAELDSAAVQFPAVLVWTPENQSERFFGGTTLQIWSWLPVALAIVDHESFRDESRDADYLAWRLLIRQTFHEKRNAVALASPYVCNWSVVEPGAILGNKLGPMQYLASTMTIKFWVIEPRG